jgi:large subunit ribosomal protein L25
VPAVLYGGGGGHGHLWIPGEEAGRIVEEKRRVLSLKVGGKSVQVIVKEIQYDPLGEEILHMDFQRLVKGEKMEVRIGVVLKGEPLGLREGGVLEHHIQQVTLLADPTILPPQLEVNVSALHLGDHVSASELVLPAGAELIGETGATVAAVVAPREEREEPEEAEEEEAKEPEVTGKGGAVKEEDQEKE